MFTLLHVLPLIGNYTIKQLIKLTMGALEVLHTHTRILLSRDILALMEGTSRKTCLCLSLLTPLKLQSDNLTFYFYLKLTTKLDISLVSLPILKSIRLDFTYSLGKVDHFISINLSGSFSWLLHEYRRIVRPAIS